MHNIGITKFLVTLDYNNRLCTLISGYDKQIINVPQCTNEIHLHSSRLCI